MENSYDPWGDIDKWLDIEQAIAELDAWESQILVLWLEGFTQHEIAARFCVSQSSISRDLKRIIAFIQVRVSCI